MQKTSKECLIEHQKFFHTTKNKDNYAKDAEYRIYCNIKRKTIDTGVEKEKQNIQTYTAVEQTQHQEK